MAGCRHAAELSARDQPIVDRLLGPIIISGTARTLHAPCAGNWVWCSSTEHLAHFLATR